MRYLIITCLLAVLCAGSENARGSSRALSGASAGILVTATVNAPFGVFIVKDGALQLEAPNNSGVFVEHSGLSRQTAVFVTVNAESRVAGLSPRIATKLVSQIFESGILDNRIFDASSTLSYDSLAETIPILTIIYTEN